MIDSENSRPDYEEVVETFASRLIHMIGDEPVSSFARRCGMPESSLRKYLTGSLPNSDNLVKMADTGGKSVEWLASGRIPKDSNFDKEELFVFLGYRQANPDQKKAIRILIETIQSPTAMGWYRLGEAISKIANIFPGKR